MRTISVVVLAGLCASGCQTLSSVTGLGGSDKPSPPPAPVVVEGPAAPAAPASTVAAKALTLKGMDSAAVMSLWGEPALRRKDIGSELWTYNKGGAPCSVLLYLYPDRDGRMLVKRSEAVPGGADDKAVDACAQSNNLPSLKPVS